MGGGGSVLYNFNTLYLMKLISPVSLKGSCNKICTELKLVSVQILLETAINYM